ncbi:MULTISPECIES: ParA family protein [Sporomusa]|jgi:chromosome partitioning protein|uniref:ParA family protein n=1 Tax=Sporomusa TaxID=2375 RepID=UPI00166F006D|nr:MULTISPECIES: ParA family protein [Sporomusa]HML33284.1 ParA family protein [Sporomusa sphaeroides]
MKIISIANRKGGVGKTVISGNIAYELLKMGYLVLMVDLDSQCDLSKIYLPGGYEGSRRPLCPIWGRGSSFTS